MKVTLFCAVEFPELRPLVDRLCADDQVSWCQQNGDRFEPDIPDVAQADLLILVFQTLAPLDWTAVETFNLRYPQATTVLIIDHDPQRLLLQAMRVGVRDVMHRSELESQLPAVIERARIRVATTHGLAIPGRILSFIPCKGGSGTSFICSNLAYIVGELHKKKVLLLDLDLQFADASFYITDDSSGPSLGDIIRRPDLDLSVIESACVRVGSHCWLLRAPQNPEQSVGISPDQLDNLLTIASEHFDFVFVDLERALDHLSLRTMDRSDAIHPVMQTVLPYVRGTQRLQRMFRALHYPENKIRLVANRLGKSEDIPLRRIEEALQTRFYIQLPNDFPNASASINSGKPLYATAPRGELTLALIQWAEELVGFSGPKSVTGSASMMKKLRDFIKRNS